MDSNPEAEHKPKRVKPALSKAGSNEIHVEVGTKRTTPTEDKLRPRPTIPSGVVLPPCDFCINSWCSEVDGWE